MEENAGRLAERILNLTLDIICLLTGESYIAFKLSDGLFPPNLKNVRSPKTCHPPPSPKPERRGNKKVQEATRKIIELLTGEVPIRCQDVAVYLSMEEREYLEGHCDRYKVAMMEEEPTLTPPGSSQLLIFPPSECWNEHPKMDDKPSAASVSSLEKLNTSHTFQTETPAEQAAHLDISTHLQNTNIEVKGGPNMCQALEKDNKTPTLYEEPEHLPQSDVTVHVPENFNIQVEEEQSFSHVLNNIFKVLTPCEKPELRPLHLDVYEQESNVHVEEEPNTSYMVTNKVPTPCEKPELLPSHLDAYEQDSNIQVEEEPNMSCMVTNTHKVPTPCEEPEVQLAIQYSKVQVKQEDILCKEDSYVIHRSMTRHVVDLFDHEITSIYNSSKIPAKRERLTLCEELEETSPNLEVYKHFLHSSNLQVKKEPILFHHPENTSEEHLPAPDVSTQGPKYSNNQVKQEPATCEEVSSADHHFIIQHAEDISGWDGVSTASFSSHDGFDQLHQSQYSDLEEHLTVQKGGLSISEHQENVVGPERTYSCSECGKCYSSNSELAIHRRAHPGQKLYACTQCDKSFTRKSNLVNHQRIHTGEKPYLCSMCGRSFASNPQLVSHQRIHRVKPHPCLECGKRFRNRWDLHIHQRSHTGERPFSCAHCGKSYTCKWSLVRHKNCK